MLRAWRNELLCVALAGLVLGGVGIATDLTTILLSVALVGYVGWHAFHLILLQRWLHGDRGKRLPVTCGIWESVFDGLHRQGRRDRQRRQFLERAVSELRQAGERLPEALVVVSQDNQVRWFNSAAERLLGLRRPNDIGKNITDLIDHPMLEDILAGSMPGQSLEMASPVNGAWMLSLALSPSFGGGSQRLLTGKDITQFHNLAQVRRDFVTNVSHELRTPITVFLGYLETLRGMAESSRLGEPIAMMESQAIRMRELVNDLLLLSRIEMAGRSKADEIVPIADMLATVVEEAQLLSGTRGHHLSLSADSGLVIRGDRSELQSAFSNLIFNAVRHTPAGTEIEISWEGRAGGARFEVRDFGEGISPHHLPRLTERFYRVDPSRARHSGGTGLGLAIVKHVLEHYDAELTINSEVGRGSSFACQFPGHLVDKTPSPGIKNVRIDHSEIPEMRTTSLS